MKLGLLLLMFCGMSLVLKAQEVALLPKDETGKYIYYEVVTAKAEKDSLQVRLKDFLAKRRAELKLKPETGQKVVVATGKMKVRKSMAMLSHPTGEITYVFNFEQGEGKYRFWLTDFVFVPYQKDRYGNFVPATAVGVPLEVEPKKSNAEQWEDYAVQVAQYAADFAKQLKAFLEAKKASYPSTTEQKVVSKNW